MGLSQNYPTHCEPIKIEMTMAVPMQLARIIISEISDNQVIYLPEINGQRQFILIGIFEATSIDRHIKSDFKPLRPLTRFGSECCRRVGSVGGECLYQ